MSFFPSSEWPQYKRDEFYFRFFLVSCAIIVFGGLTYLMITAPPCRILDNDEGSNFKVTTSNRTLGYFPTPQDAVQFIATTPECRDE